MRADRTGLAASLQLLRVVTIVAPEDCGSAAISELFFSSTLFRTMNGVDRVLFDGFWRVAAGCCAVEPYFNDAFESYLELLDVTEGQSILSCLFSAFKVWYSEATGFWID